MRIARAPVCTPPPPRTATDFFKILWTPITQPITSDYLPLCVPNSIMEAEHTVIAPGNSLWGNLSIGRPEAHLPAPLPPSRDPEGCDPGPPKRGRPREKKTPPRRGQIR